LGIKVRDCAFFSPVGEVAPSPWLVHSLEAGMSVYTVSEKARGEFIVAPIMLECRSHLKGVNVFSGVRLDGDPEAGLVGECDFILARTRSRLALQTPLMVIRQATKHDVIENLWPCAAQMLGAIKYNERLRPATPHVYGCVTSGYSWMFLKLQGGDLQIHPQHFEVTETGKLLWLFVECVKDAGEQVSDAS
jgi:hypothetical protein